jgi:mono/diheme cytochrome c family protein
MRKPTLALALVAAACMLIPSCKQRPPAAKPDPFLKAYDVERDWNNPDHLISLDYQQAQGKRIFYEKCVWCHADSTPAGPSNRSNLNPAPPLVNDGTVFNSLSDEFLGNVITLGGGAMGKSAIMPPWGRTLTQDQIQALVAYIRAAAQPPYQRPAQPGPKYSAR